MDRLEQAARGLDPLAWQALGTVGDTIVHESYRNASLLRARAVLEQVAAWMIQSRNIPQRAIDEYRRDFNLEP